MVQNCRTTLVCTGEPRSCGACVAPHLLHRLLLDVGLRRLETRFHVHLPDDLRGVLGRKFVDDPVAGIEHVEFFEIHGENFRLGEFHEHFAQSLIDEESKPFVQVEAGFDHKIAFHN